MRIVADVNSMISAERLLAIEHDGKRLTFPLSLYKKNSFAQDNETFTAINEYWESLPPEAHDAMYAVYEDIRELFDSATGSDELKEELTDMVARLMEYHQTKDVINWIKYKSRLTIPDSIKPSFVYDVDKNTTVDRTYVHEDYLGLMAISLILRCMIPIWSMFNKPSKDAIGNVKKEERAFMLMSKSEIYHSEAMERLKRYIIANSSKDTYTGNHTLEFVTSSDMPMWLLSRVCVKRLCMGELYPDASKQNLAALTYVSFIDQPPPNANGGDHSQQVKTKQLMTKDSGENSENSGSTLEIYKARSTVTVGQMAEMEYALRDLPDLARQLCPFADPDIVTRDCERAFVTARDMLIKGIQTPQIILAQWVINPVFPAQGLMYVQEDLFTRDEIMHRVCAMVETVLRHRNFGYLALLSTAVPMMDETSLSVAPVGSRAQLSEDLVQALSVNFPFKREPKRKTGAASSYDFVQEDIRRLSADFSQFTWRATADEALVRSVLNTHVRRIPIQPSLRSDIGYMLVKAEEDLN